VGVNQTQLALKVLELSLAKCFGEYVSGLVLGANMGKQEETCLAA